jgi:DNA-binding transcriptional LysR family regulator
VFAKALGRHDPGAAEEREALVLAMRSLSWPGIELRHFIALCAVAEERSFGRAAKRLGYTQSAVSQQIAALERAVGHRLLERAQGRGAIELTLAGRIIVDHAETIARELSLTRASLDRLQRAERALEVGMHATTGLHLFPEIVERLGDGAGALVRLRESANARHLLDLVAHDELDVAFAQLPFVDELASLQLVRDDYVAVVAAPLAEQLRSAPLDARALAPYPLLVLRAARSNLELGRYFEEAAVPLSPVFEADDPATICELACRGHGVALLPRLLADACLAGIALELEQAPTWRLGIVWRDRPTATTGLRERFVEAARHVFTCAAAVRRLQLKKAG